MSMLATYTPQPIPSPPPFAMASFTRPMGHQHQIHYTFRQAPPPQTPRQYSGHGTSSAFSSSANPDEDWTKISDLAERRRIQNRIAQRNYRKKLKRRLEDLERRAGSPEGPDGDKPSPPAPKAKRAPSTKASKPRPEPTVAKPAPQMQFTPPLESNDDFLFNHGLSAERMRSHTPPTYPASTNYPAPDETALLPPYGAGQPYQHMSSMDSYPAYLSAATMASTVPSMTHFSDAFKRESYSSDSGVGQFPQYPFYSGVDVSDSSPYDQSNPHTPPLSHGFDHSANCSEVGYDYPTTPLSMPGSPEMVQTHHL